MLRQTGPSPPHARPGRRVTNEAWVRGPQGLATPWSETIGPKTLLLGERWERRRWIPPWPLRKRCQPLPFTHRTGSYGITWEFMGVNGNSREMTWSTRDICARLLELPSFFVNRAAIAAS